MMSTKFSKPGLNEGTIWVSWQLILIFYLVSLAIYGSIARIQSAPGYMDADYYYAGGLQIARGDGLWEPFLWNYLDDPQSLPHPSNAYWMPLAAWVTALGMLLTGVQTFNAAQIGMVVVAAGIPPLTVVLARQFSDQPQDAFIAGGLALFSGFYFPFMTTTDTFGIYMLLGTVFLLLVGKGVKEGSNNFTRIMWPMGLGIIAGLMHLARADGMIWLAVGGLAGLVIPTRFRKQAGSNPSFLSLILWLGVCLAGYLLVMGPWMVRNLNVFGTLLAPGGARALWITNYNELFIYPATELTFQHWLQAGIKVILAARWQAFLLNLQTILAVQGQIFLVPLILLGAWKLRGDVRVRIGLVAWALTLFAMTIVFPYQGARGGLFHSGSAVQPLFWALAPVGLHTMVDWAGRIRKWNIEHAQQIFRFGLIGLAVFLTMVLAASRVIGTDLQDPLWNHNIESYQEMGTALRSLGAQSGDIVMVNNAPGFFIATGLPALSVPDGSLEKTNQVGQRYKACYLLLEPDHPVGMDPFYNRPEDHPGLIYLRSVAQTHIFRFERCARITE